MTTIETNQEASNNIHQNLIEDCKRMDQNLEAGLDSFRKIIQSLNGKVKLHTKTVISLISIPYLYAHALIFLIQFSVVDSLIQILCEYYRPTIF